MGNIGKSLSVIFVPAFFMITAYGFGRGQEIIFFNIAYAFLAISCLFLERLMPHEKSWNEDDGQTFANIAHTLSSKGTVQTIKP